MDGKQKHKLNIKISTIVYCLICNIPVCFFLCLASSIANRGVSNIENHILTINFANIDWASFGANYALALVLAMIIGIFVPLTLIGRWFTGLFHVKNDTYAGNMKYRLLSTLIITIIYYLGISPTLMFANYFYSLAVNGSASLGDSVVLLLFNIPLMLIVGFVSSLISDLGAYKLAHTIDKDF